MKRQWTTDELVAHWMLEPPELELVNQARTDKNRLGLALLLKWFQYESRFPKRKQEIPAVLLDYLANQLSTDSKNLKEYTWEGRTIARHRGLVRDYLGFREASVKDAEGLTAWLVEAVLGDQSKTGATISTSNANSGLVVDQHSTLMHDLPLVLIGLYNHHIH